MRKANGFIFMETIVVVSVLSVTLLSLFSSFSFILKKSRERETYDTTAYIYKTFLVSKELLQQASSQASDSDNFMTALKSYIAPDPDHHVNKNNCLCYKLTEYPEGVSNNNNNQNNNGSNEAYPHECKSTGNNYDNHLVVCKTVNNNGVVDNNNSLQAVSKVFNIQSVYLVTPSKLMESSEKDAIYRELDATAIDYLNAKALTTDKLFIVKYKANYVGLSNDQNKEYSIFFSSMAVD